MCLYFLFPSAAVSGDNENETQRGAEREKEMTNDANILQITIIENENEKITCAGVIALFLLLLLPSRFAFQSWLSVNALSIIKG